MGTQDRASARAAVLGTWEYRVEGRAELTRGTFQIVEQDDRFRAILRDDARGRLIARVSVDSTQMELSLNDLRISGRIEDGHFTGHLYRSIWDVSTPSSRRRTFRTRSTPFVARRTGSPVGIDQPLPLECTPILRETGAECD